MLKKIKALQLKARKERDKVTASSLTTLIGEVETFGKNAGNRAPTDNEVIKIIRKFIKNIDSNLKLDLKNKNLMVVEKELYKSLLPVGITDDKLIYEIKLELQKHDLSENKTVGITLRALKEKLGDELDSAYAVKLIKNLM